MGASTIWTVGHSTRSWPEFLAVLAPHRIEAIADVRRFPGSRRHPQFAREAMEPALATAGLEYRWMPELGGRREPRPDSRNTGWRNASFRAYADYMETAGFAAGLDALLALAARRRTAVLCAEALWWRCHRSLISDALRVRGIEVVHLVDAKEAVAHPWTAPARVVDGRLTYAAVATEPLDLE